MQFRIFQDIGVQRGNAVNAVAEMNIHICHMHAVFSVDNLNSVIIASLSGSFIELFDNRH